LKRTPRNAAGEGAELAWQGERLLRVGRVGGPHGVRGELRVRLFNPESDVLGSVADVFLVAGDSADVRRFSVRRARPATSIWLLELESIDSRELAAALAGRDLAVPETALAPLAPREYYGFQLIGLAVVDESGACVGTVRDVLSSAGHDVLTLDDAAGTERMIPLVEEFVREVDLGARRIVVRPIAGLLDG
jgi:16S rRNA processing protein RimM